MSENTELLKERDMLLAKEQDLTKSIQKTQVELQEIGKRLYEIVKEIT